MTARTDVTGPATVPTETPVAVGKSDLTVTRTDASVGELLSDVSRDLSTLMRQEVELAKAEVRESAKRAGKGSGMLAGAGISGHLVLVFLSVAVWWALGNATGRGWSGVIVAAIWLVIAGIFALLGRKELQSVQGMPRTAETVKRIPPAVKGEGRA